MPVTKLGISIPVELLVEIDKISQELKKNRSEVIREAITKMINDYKKQQVVEYAEKIYKEIAEDDKHVAEDFLGICEKPVAIRRSVNQ
jgi:metal-responsive CopG/Arc/MetJ family transcriptional regulator